jgi:acyl-CoA synthetase (AMP-forming)/AMP-acid ligase II/uncharacterized membrane protein
MRIHERLVIDAPIEQVWDVVADPGRYPAVLDGVESFTPNDPEQPPAVGARYAMRFFVGSAPIGGTVELTEHDAPHDLAWTSVTGIDQRGHLLLRREGDGTRLEFRFSYGAPGAVLGTLAEVAAYRQVAAYVRHSLINIRALAEGRPRPVRGRPHLLGSAVSRALHEADNLRILARSGLIAPMRPDKPARMGLAALKWGGSIAALVSTGAIRHPHRPIVIDDLGEISYAELDAQSNAVANTLRTAGVEPGARVGLMCRDHRGFVAGAVAAGKLGADVLLLNTSFSGKQLGEVCDREDAAALIYDEEFADLVADAGRGRIRMVGWHEDEDVEELTIGAAIRDGDRSAPPRPGRTGRVTILTSGTTGTPKGASRQKTPLTLDPPAALLERIPFLEGQVVRIGAPLFHAWGFANFALGLSLGSTFVLRRKFDPEQTLADIAEYGCSGLVVVPVMLQRMLALPEDVRAKYDVSSLTAVAASGSALPGELATRWMDAFGDNLYNMYGSTEVATGTLATPADLRAAPGTAGKPARGVVLRIYDADGRVLPQGESGRIFVGNSMLFEGYTGGGSKDQLDGLMATGDVGYLDPAGRLFVQGRDDEMIVSGGENVFPKEVEDVLADHPAVAEAACIGVDDDDFGQRLKAFVVLQDGQSASEDDLKAHVRSNLARYKVPREVVFLDELPRNPTGKVLKRELTD